MTLVSALEWESCLLAPRPDPELERRLHRETGRAGPVAYFGASGWVPAAAARLNAPLRNRVHVPDRIANLVVLVVSQENSCRYCYAVQRAMMRVLGYPEREIRALEQDLLTADLRRAERAALDYARRVSRSTPLPTDRDLEALREAGFDDATITELTALVGLSVFFNRISTLPALPPEAMEALPDRWITRLARPLIARGVRRVMRRERPVPPLPPAECAGPWAYLVEALAGLPLAGVLRGVLDDAFASPVLPRRSQAFVYAVVARALGCGRSEEEALRLLEAEGVSREASGFALAHLASRDLTPVEAVVVPFARDTVWYTQAAPVQRRAREMRDALGDEAVFVECIATIALANMVCRLGVATQVCG